MTSIDDNRLRRLLEELYKDKKYFDKYIARPGKLAIDPSSYHVHGVLLSITFNQSGLSFV